MPLRRIASMGLCAGLLAVMGFAAQVPRRSPELAITMPGGKQVLLSQHRGKVVAVIFLLTYCPHCQHTVQILSKLQNEYGPRGFQVLGSSIEDMAAMMVPDFIKRFQPPFPVGYNERNSALEYLQHPAMFKLLMPQLVFVDRGGTIRAQFAGDDQIFGGDQEKNLRAQVESLLNEGAGAASQKKTTTTRARKKS